MATLNDLKGRLLQNTAMKEALESPEYARSRMIFKRRMKLGLSQVELAEKAGLTQKTISRIEGADQGIRESTVGKVYAALEMDETEASSAKKYVLHR